jgi:hypothetical protein
LDLNYGRSSLAQPTFLAFAQLLELVCSLQRIGLRPEFVD